MNVGRVEHLGECLVLREQKKLQDRTRERVLAHVTKKGAAESSGAKTNFEEAFS